MKLLSYHCFRHYYGLCYSSNNDYHVKKRAPASWEEDTGARKRDSSSKALKQGMWVAMAKDSDFSSNCAASSMSMRLHPEDHSSSIFFWTVSMVMGCSEQNSSAKETRQAAFSASSSQALSSGFFWLRFSQDWCSCSQ